MLPLSLGHVPALNTEHQDADESAAWFRPANIASAKSSELRALIAWLAFFVVLGVMIALGHVWLRLKVVDLGYQLLTTRQLIEKLAQEEHELTIEVATLDASGRLEELARTRLGMVRPEKGQAVVLP
jgi:cell division protein FtsL